MRTQQAKPAEIAERRTADRTRRDKYPEQLTQEALKEYGKRYVTRIPALDNEIRRLSDEAERLSRTAQHPGDADVRTEARQLRAKLLKKRKKLRMEREEILKRIKILPDARHAQLLWLRYVQRESFKEIALDMGYTYNYVRWLHAPALEAMGSMLCGVCGPVSPSSGDDGAASPGKTAGTGT
ncbi:MAG: hypothetical protein IJJ85_08410 [Clostridia bacterium]|nr:hypothetical protein [Clostridia bacterium]